ncbi:hypothetical protein KAR91_12045 [Candidatus Pacearchaeota archaeon]|nr:hypothetical protein [Candidatus Pacearchaeota archaeon]
MELRKKMVWSSAQSGKKEKIVFSSSDDATPAVEAVKDFLIKNNVEDSEPLQQWQDRCAKISS